MRWFDRVTWAVLFFISGFSALIYEILWIRDFSFLLGNSTYTISVVLAAYMAGLAIGSFLSARWAPGCRNPLWVYSLLEGGIGACGLGIHYLFQSGLKDLGPIGAADPGDPLSMAARFAVSFALLLPPTALMGATLPYLSRLFPPSGAGDGSFLGLMYGVNTLGAALGCFVTGFFFLRLWGMRKSTFFAVALNLGVALCALLLGFWRRSRESRSDTAKGETPGGEYRAGTGRFLLAAFAVSGFTCMAYELVFFRWLSYLLGNRVYASSAMITTFLLGIALGSLAVGWVVDKWGGELRLFSFCQILTGASALALAVFFPDLTAYFQRLEERLAPQDPWRFVAIRFGEAFALLFLPAFSFGAIFPSVLKYLHRGAAALPGVVGRAYGINTLGCIAGSLLTGFFLIPRLGSYHALIAVAVVSLFLGHRFWAPRWEESTIARKVCSVAFSLALVIFGGAWAVSSSRYPWPKEGLSLVYSREDAAAMVTVRQGPLGYYLHADDTELSFPIGPRTRAVAVQKLQAHLPLLLHPAPKRVLVVGLGFGVTAGSFASDPGVETVECVEIFPAVIPSMSIFKESNRDILAQPKVRLIAGDGRYYLRHARQAYDIIASNLTGSDLPGSASCYTREYFQSACDHLAPGGLFLVHAYGPDRPITLKTLLSVFPHVSGFRAYTGTQYLVASLQPLSIDRKRIERRVASDKVFKADARRAGIWGYQDLERLTLFNTREAVRVANSTPGPLNTDDLPILEYRFKGRSPNVFLSKL